MPKGTVCVFVVRFGCLPSSLPVSFNVKSQTNSLHPLPAAPCTLPCLFCPLSVYASEEELSPRGLDPRPRPILLHLGAATVTRSHTMKGTCKSNRKGNNGKGGVDRTWVSGGES
mmetsp:Transcript_15162/g.30737  ORF Transcript_15162/g.30737 Transcript_15162/m.30737 type:complete len:114 (+) Transcript_15162:3385-3726(+)